MFRNFVFHHGGQKTEVRGQRAEVDPQITQITRIGKKGIEDEKVRRLEGEKDKVQIAEVAPVEFPWGSPIQLAKDGFMAEFGPKEL